MNRGKIMQDILKRGANRFPLGTLMLLTLSGPAYATTGAEFLQMDQGFASAYVLGVVDGWINLYRKDDEHWSKTRQCVLASKLDANSAYLLTRQYILNHPPSMKEPILGAIVKSINEMCD